MSANDDHHAPLCILYQHVLNTMVFGGSNRKMMETMVSIHQPLSASAIAGILYPNEKRKGKSVWIENYQVNLLDIVH